VGEEEIEAAVNQSRREEVLGARKRGRDGPAIEAHVLGKSSSELRVALVLAKFGQHFGTAPFGAFLLGDGIVGTGETGR
jgi:hypothetical protein